ncbi:hypothetical protein [Martelella endophytica]|uniref:Uncharacterized protein n=1 Tax=Martelella endophytica TaxID=1486262 RepID=A0A0D5LL08_MAREN|nr:hypothetical protein [Martelella endophytica]AJY44650.1 hypothetical protein TM49_01465 [Martelella endophytica]
MQDDASPRRVKVECKLCSRYGEYREDRFFWIAGTDSAPSALLAFARNAKCPRALKQVDGRFDDRCQIKFRLDGLPSDRFLAGERRTKAGT